jgi:hypothetical protein
MGSSDNVQIAAFLQKINQETERPLTVKRSAENGHKKEAESKVTFDPIGRRLQIHQ